MPFLETPNCTLYYDVFEPDVEAAEAGKAQTVLLLHGFGGTPESDFAAQLPELRRRYTVVTPHLHGYGKSSQRSSYPVSYYRDDVVDLITLLDALEIERVLVLAFSDGAITGLLLTALHPERVVKLAAMGAQSSINEENVAAIRYWLLERPLSEEWQEELARLHGEPYWRELPRMYVEAQVALVDAGGVLVTDEELACIRCPTLIMHGARDRIVPADYARYIHEHIPGSQLLLFDAGHAAHLRCQEEYTGAALRFLES
jgi:valacyclovir hydrolase